MTVNYELTPVEEEGIDSRKAVISKWILAGFLLIVLFGSWGFASYNFGKNSAMHEIEIFASPGAWYQQGFNDAVQQMSEVPFTAGRWPNENGKAEI